MIRKHRGWCWKAVFTALFVSTVLVSSALGQRGESQDPKIGMVSIDAVDPETGMRPGRNADTLDFKIAWELCAPVDTGESMQWSSEKFQAYYWNTPTAPGEIESTDDLPTVGVDSSGYVDGQEYTFRDKASNQQSYFLVKGVLKGDHDDSLVILSPVSMDIFPRPVIMVSLWQKMTEWIEEKGLRTLVILAVILFLFLLGLYWARVCFQRQNNRALFPGKNVHPEDILQQVTKGGKKVSDSHRDAIVNAVGRSLDMVDAFRPSTNGKELAQLPTYRVVEAAVRVYLSEGSTADEIQGTIERQIGIELSDLRTDSKADWIWNTGYIEPLIGLFGTVTGLALAFSAKVADRDSDMYAGIYEALYTTIAGLFTGIILVLIYNAADHRYRRLEGAFQRLGTELVTSLRTSERVGSKEGSR